MLRAGNICRGLLPQLPERLPEGQIFLVRAPHPHPRGEGRVVVTRGSTVKHAMLSDLVGEVPPTLTFLKSIPEGARPTHCSALLIQRHGAVPEAAVSVGVILAICIGQAVGPQHRWVGQAHLGDSGGTCWNQRSRMNCWISILLFESQPGTSQRLLIASSVCACQLHSLVYF